ncbi:sialate O-acetylesterase [Aeoliella mucimassa]|uniref:sialate O-acetylesterase n=1 Tax=Aeoliella mucimassa TaxID=2527972 RepID=UPI0018D39AF1|nr:sialate O-acetylesterase [Aeoliella mucimassa]
MAELRLPSLFTDHMVLQRDEPVPVWGWSDPQATVYVVFAGQTKTTTADENGRWQVTLDPLSVGDPRSLVVEAKQDRLEVKDVLVGEVWICSGQSNMQYALAANADGDLDTLHLPNPNLRYLTVNGVGTQKTCDDFDGAWETDQPGVRKEFSAIGYHFGNRLQGTLGVPIGLIDHSWGGSSCEAWVPREELSGNPLYEPLLKRWDDLVAESDEPAEREKYARIHQDWKNRMLEAVAAGEPIPNWQRPRHQLLSQKRPSNLYHSRVEPLMPMAFRGVIWYQGETNASRAEQYRELFPLMIDTWREHWGQGEFPFYWVQLADYRAEREHPSESDWAELREAQTFTLDRVANTAQVVIIDAGDGIDVHPSDKQLVGDRLARIALTRDYGIEVPYLYPRFVSMEVKEGSIVVELDNVGGGLKTHDKKPVLGFAIAGEERNWVWAEARITGNKRNKVEVSSDEVPEPVAVRYAWADNPVCNLNSSHDLPVTPFRTDDWPMVTAGKH